MQEQPDIPHFPISYINLQRMFTTENIQTGVSADILEGLGGIDQLLDGLGTNRKKGIEKHPTLQRKATYGVNRIPPPPQTPFWYCVYKQTKDFCIRILALAAALMFLLATVSSDPFESIVQAVSILLAIMAVVLIGGLTDYRKEKQFIKLYLEQEVAEKKLFFVTREGREMEMEHFELHVGDIIKIKAGDNVTVDGILLSGSEYLEVDESMITGLTDSLKRQPIEFGKECFLRGGSNIFEGMAQLVVVAVGENTFSNRMKLQDEGEEEQIVHDEQSPLSKALETIAKFLVFIGCMAALAMFIVLELYMVRELRGLQQKVLSQLTLRKSLSDFIDAFLIIVLSIPEGLPLIVTLSMAFSIAKLKERDVVIRNLHVCQVLGGIDTICFDKTGTLTKNNLTVTERHISAESPINIQPNDPAFRAMAECVIANNTATLPEQRDKSLHSSQQSQKQPQSSMSIKQIKLLWQGNRLDSALMESLDEHLNQDFVVEYQTEITGKVRKLISFGHAPYCATVLQNRGDAHRIYIKGKSKEVLEKCSEAAMLSSFGYSEKQHNVWAPGQDFVTQECATQKMTHDLLEDEKKYIHDYQENSYKTVSFAYKDVSISDISGVDWDTVLYGCKDFVFIGTQAMRDDIRPEAKNLDAALRRGTINVQILTGDTRVNTVNVAKQLEWVNKDKAQQEIERQSEHLAKSSQQQFIQEAAKPNPLDDIQGEKVSSSIINIPHEDVEPLLQHHKEQEFDSQVSQFKEPLIINFHEYVKNIRTILEESKIFFTHSEVNDKNIISKIPEILEDNIAKRKLMVMNQRIQILADLNPQQKDQFLQLLGKINESTIGYVGDGNNDARALRQADVGFALGQTATNVAKECSGVILMGDRLEGIEDCVKWGRNIFANIKRFIYFQLSFFLTSISVMLTASIVIKQQPYSVLEVIWLSLVQDIFSAIALSTEIPQSTILAKTQPIRKGQNLIDGFLLKLTSTQAVFQYICTIIVLFAAPTLFGIEPSYNHDINEIGGEFNPEWAIHYTLVYHITAMFQIINLMNSRRIGHNEYNITEGITKNKPFTFMMILLVVVQQVIIYAGGKYFKTAPLTIMQNLFCCILSFGSLLIFWLSKYIFSDPTK